MSAISGIGLTSGLPPVKIANTSHASAVGLRDQSAPAGSASGADDRRFSRVRVEAAYSHAVFSYGHTAQLQSSPSTGSVIDTHA